MKLLQSFLKDMKLAAQSYYFYLELIFALIIVAVLLFVVPENFKSKMTVYAASEVEGPYRAALEEGLSGEEFNVIVLDSRAAVEERLKEDRRSVGMVISQENGKVVYDYILQGYEHQRIRNVIAHSIESQFASRMPGYVDATTVVTLEPNSEKLSSRLNVLPVYLALNAAFMGLFIIAAYVFLDKEEGTIKAFRVTPARVWQYLASKMGVMLVAGLASGLLATILVAGGKAHYLHLIILLIATNLFGSALGLLIASFFNTMTKAMGALYLAVIVLGFAAVSYYVPAFSPWPIRILPSYPMLFAYKQTLLNRPDLGMIYWNVLGFSIATVAVFLLSNWRFKKTITV